MDDPAQPAGQRTGVGGAGVRATWPDRARLAVAKLGGRVEPDASSDSFPRLLLSCGGAGPENDDYVEVHVYGSITARTLERVKIGNPRTTPRAVLREWLVELLEPLGVEVL